MSHEKTIKLSGPGHRKYNKVDFLEGSDITLKFDLSTYHPEWKSQYLNLTIYDEKAGTTLLSVPFDEDKFEVTLNDFSPDNPTAFVAVEDRRDINNIDLIEAVAFIAWIKFAGGQKITQQLGYGNYIEADDTVLTIPHFQTEFAKAVEVTGYVNFTEESGNKISVPIYNQGNNLV